MDFYGSQKRDMRRERERGINHETTFQTRLHDDCMQPSFLLSSSAIGLIKEWNDNLQVYNRSWFPVLCRLQPSITIFEK